MCPGNVSICLYPNNTSIFNVYLYSILWEESFKAVFWLTKRSMCYMGPVEGQSDFSTQRKKQVHQKSGSKIDTSGTESQQIMLNYCIWVFKLSQAVHSPAGGNAIGKNVSLPSKCCKNLKMKVLWEFSWATLAVFRAHNISRVESLNRVSNMHLKKQEVGRGRNVSLSSNLLRFAVTFVVGMFFASKKVASQN